MKLKLDTTDINLNLKYFEDILKSTSLREFEADISHFNIIDAAKNAHMLSSLLYCKKPEFKIHFYVKDAQTFKLISLRKLKNMELSVKNNIKRLNLDSEKKIWLVN